MGFCIIYFLSPLVLIASIYFSNPLYFGAADFFRLITMIFGATAFTLLNMQLVLSARPKLIEKSFGLDKLYRFHGIMALVAILLAGIHQQFMEGIFRENLQTNFGSAALAVFFICAVLALVLMTNALVQKFKQIENVKVFFKNKKFGQYNIQVLLHNLNVVAVCFLFVHVMLSFSAQNPLVKVLYILYFGVAMGFYLYHKLIRPIFFTKKFQVDKVILESASMTTLELHPVNGKIFSYKPGQFAFIRLKDSAISAEEHPFSLTSEPDNEKTISMTIKKLGDWTEKVSEVQPGSMAMVDGPYGKFSPLNYDCSEGLVLVAGGVGITPMLSIIRYFEKHDRNQKIILFWGIKNNGDFICGNEFKRWLKEMKNFTFIPVVSEGGFSGETGHINRKIMERYLQKSAYKIDRCQYFFCGPRPMRGSIEKILLEMGVSKQRFHFENFSL